MAKRLVHSILLAGTACLASPAAAQADAPGDRRQAVSAGNEQAAGSGDIVVTANKREQKLSTVGASVSVATGAFLNEVHARGLADYVGYMPNVALQPQGPPGLATISVRGISTVGTASSIGTYIDDAPFGSSTSFALGGILMPDIDPSNLQQVEVLKGPQGTLYGAGSVGGLIKFVTLAPNLSTSSLGGSVEIESVDGGGFGYAARAHGNLLLSHDKAGIRLSGYYRRNPGYVDNVWNGVSDYNDGKSYGGHASLLLKPFDTVTIRLSGLYQRLQSDGLPAVAVDEDGAPFYGKRKSGLRNASYSDTRDGLFSASISADFDWAELTSVTSYSFVRNRNAAGDPGFDNEDYEIPETDTLFQGNRAHTHKVAQEIRLASPDKGAVQWLVGGFFTRETSSGISTTIANRADGSVDDDDIPGGLFYYRAAPSNYREFSAFGNVTYYLLPNVDVTVGGRYSIYVQNYSQRRAGVFGNPNDPTTDLVYPNVHSRDTKATYSAGVRYHFDSNGLLYFRFATGFATGGPSILPPNVAPPAGYTGRFGPENIYNYEWGVRQSFWDGKLRLSVAAFLIDFRDLQGSILIGRYAVRGNAGNARSKGVEVSADLQPVNGLSISGAVGYTDSHLLEDSDAFDALRGDRLPYAPRVTSSLDVEYRQPVALEWEAWVGAGVRYTARQYSFFSSAGDAIALAPHALVDLRAGVRGEGFTISAFVRNALNKSAYIGDVTPSVGPLYLLITQPRTIGLSIAKEF